MKTTEKFKEFIELYNEIIFSVDFEEISTFIYDYSKNQMINFFSTVEYKIDTILEYFKENKKELSTKENLQNFITEIENNELFFDSDSFYNILNKYNLEENIKDMKNLDKNIIYEIFISLIDYLLEDFQDLLDYWENENKW